MNREDLHSRQVFQFARFKACMRRYLSLNGRKLLLLSLGILASFLIISLLELLTDYTRIWGYGQPMLPSDFLWSTDAEILTLAVPFIATIGGSMMYSSMNTRQRRLTELMLPASQCEKFLTYLVIYLPLLLVLTFGMFWLSDIIKIMVLKLSASTASEVRMLPIWRILTFFGYPEWSDSQSVTVVSAYGSILAGNALFALGSIVFQKYSYLKSYCFIFVLQTAIVILFVISYDIIFGGASTRIRLDDLSTSSIIWIIGAGSLALAVGFHWLAYARFKESEYVSRW